MFLTINYDGKQNPGLDEQLEAAMGAIGFDRMCLLEYDDPDYVYAEFSDRIDAPWKLEARQVRKEG